MAIVITKISGKKGNKVIRTAQLFKNMIYPDAIILMYHRVANLDSDPWSLAVKPKNFAEHLQIIQKHGYPLHLKKLRKKLSDRHPINRSIVVTFDDGYVDNFYNAKPLLEKYDIPATFFVTTSVIGYKNEYWWDRLGRILLQPGILPESINLDIRGKAYQWKLGVAANYSEMDLFKNRHWRIHDEPNNGPTSRHELYREIYQILLCLNVHERDQVLDDLHVKLSDASEYCESNRQINHEELIALDREDLIEVGAHTVTHPYLSELPTALQKAEITNSKDQLEDKLGHTVTSFAYPHGNYNSKTVSLVKEAGFKCACSCKYKRVKPNNNLFLLPRVAVEDLDGEAFVRWLSRSVY